MIAEMQITLGDLIRLLDEQGFVPASRLGNSRWFRHRSGAQILLPINPSPRRTAVAVSSIRADLDDYGLMERHEFDEWMWRLAIARKDKGGGPATGNGAAANGKPPNRATSRPQAKGPARRATKPPARQKLRQPSR